MSEALAAVSEAGREEIAQHMLHEIDEFVASTFRETLRTLSAAFTLLDEDACGLDARRFDVGGVQVAVALRADRDRIGFYVDIGKPGTADADAMCRRLLELNHSADATQRVMELCHAPQLAQVVCAELAGQALVLRNS